MRSWQDWFPDGEVISSLVLQACLYPNSEKDDQKKKKSQSKVCQGTGQENLQDE